MEINAPWIVVAPLILIGALYPIFWVNTAWENIAQKQKDWKKYDLAERTFLIPFLTDHPIQFSLFGLVISRPMMVSVGTAAVAAVGSVLSDSIIKSMPNNVNFRFE